MFDEYLVAPASVSISHRGRAAGKKKMSAVRVLARGKGSGRINTAGQSKPEFLYYRANCDISEAGIQGRRIRLIREGINFELLLTFSEMPV
jgi:hypothetical protein